MTIDRRLFAGALGLSLILAACGGSSTGGSGATAAPGATGGAATAAAEPTDAPETAEPVDTEEPVETEEATDGTEPSFVAGAASDLEAMLPDEAGGVKFQKSSFDGASLGMLGGSIDTAELDPILKANGKTINDVRVAIAAPADSAAGEAGMVIAFQIKGVDAKKFMEAMGADPATLTNATIGGKQVLQAGEGGFGVIIYPKDDVLFEILMASPEVGASIVEQLP